MGLCLSSARMALFIVTPHFSSTSSSTTAEMSSSGLPKPMMRRSACAMTSPILWKPTNPRHDLRLRAAARQRGRGTAGATWTAPLWEPETATKREKATAMEGTERGRGRDLHERPRYVVQSALNAETKPSRALDDTERAIVGQHAGQSGFIGMAAAGVISGGAVLAANRASPWFRGALGISGKTALVITPPAFAFFLRSQQTINRANKDPEGYLEQPAAAAAAVTRRTSLAWWQHGANAVYNHPIKTIIGTALPTYAAIFYRESIHPSTAGMLLSQRLIQCAPPRACRRPRAAAHASHVRASAQHARVRPAGRRDHHALRHGLRRAHAIRRRPLRRGRAARRIEIVTRSRSARRDRGGGRGIASRRVRPARAAPLRAARPPPPHRPPRPRRGGDAPQARGRGRGLRAGPRGVHYAWRLDDGAQLIA